VPGDAEILVCVYYRIQARDRQEVIAAVRDFQRGLAAEAIPGRRVEAGVLVRYGLSATLTPPDAQPDSSPAAVRMSVVEPGAHAGSAPGADPSADRPGESTVMETYRLVLAPAGAPRADTDAVLRAFLRGLESASAGLAHFLLGHRHTEVFTPCAS
jgi:hypothetical protein